jgi:hypothetical protein
MDEASSKYGIVWHERVDIGYPRLGQGASLLSKLVLLMGLQTSPA